MLLLDQSNDDYSDIDNKMEKNFAYVTIMVLLYDSEATNKIQN